MKVSTNQYTHELKIASEYFEALKDGRKNFEIRKNDRNFKVGEVISLREYNDNGEYTGNSIAKFISYMTTYKQKDNYVVLSIQDF